MNDGDTTIEFIEATTERQDINPINKKAKKKRSNRIYWQNRLH